jgi:hypothetical protein
MPDLQAAIIQVLELKARIVGTTRLNRRQGEMKRHCRMEASSISRALSVIGMALVLPIVAACATSKVQVVRRYAAGERRKGV